jgi:transposase
MFLRRVNIRKNGKPHYYWALVESYRTEKGSRQRLVCYIGDVTKSKAKGLALSAQTIDSVQQDFLSPEELPELATIQPKKTRTERQREFGAVWLGSLLFKKLGLDEYFSEHLSKSGHSAWIEIIKVLVISRFYHPSSELFIAEHLYEQSAMEDFFGIPASQIYDNRLYRGLDVLLPHKDPLQKHLKERLGELFNLEYDLFLYDVTSTYVEGDHSASKLCQRGYSRDSRPDCKQVCIGLVVTREGLPLGYEVFAGNTHDSRTVETIVQKMETSYGKANRIWVMDRGMVSENNLAYLRSENRRYIIGTPKASLKNVEQQLLEKSDWQAVHAGVDVKVCQMSDGKKDEVFILCKSKDRALKEQSMHDRFVKRIEDGLEKLKNACEQRAGKDITKLIERRVGRLLQQNSRGAGLFEITTTFDNDSKKTQLHIQKNDTTSHWLRLTEGHYLLRTNITDWDAKALWEAYIHLTDAEEAFKIHKSDLHIRPLWHQKDERIEAHIFVCFLAFVLWKSFGLICKKAGLGDEPRRVFNEIKKICMIDVVLTTEDNKELKIRTVAKPEKPLQVLLNRLGLVLPQRLRKRNL